MFSVLKRVPAKETENQNFKKGTSQKGLGRKERTMRTVA